MKRIALLFTLIPLLALPACKTVPPYYADFGDVHRTISTSSAAAQAWFDRGLALCYGFNHEEAIRCFEKCVAADPKSPMGYWGIAYANGPNINNTAMSDEAVKSAFENIRLAKENIGNATPVEQSLIKAMATRYSPAPSDRGALDKKYAAAMRKVYTDHREDPDVAAIFAESLMVLRPWQLWSKTGQPAPETPEIMRVLESGLVTWPDHPAFCHSYIHTMEASPFPERALAAADRLRNMVPGSGHLVHMPSHIDILVGQYPESILANQKAIAADLEYAAKEGKNNFYTLYRIHNYHFLVYGAMFDGQSKLAEEAARDLVTEIPDELLQSIPDFVEAFIPTVYHVLVRFGQWEKILAEPQPNEELFVTRAMWHYARGIAYAATNRVEQAKKEAAAFDKAVSKVPATRFLFQNSSLSILAIANAMLDGEIAYRDENMDEAFKQLRHAVALDDALNYDEPWGWMQPARHALGALLLEQSQVAEAEKVFEEDLQRHPHNPWALHGLHECQKRNEKPLQAAKTRARFIEATARSDVEISASCYCRLTSFN